MSAAPRLRVVALAVALTGGVAPVLSGCGGQSDLKPTALVGKPTSAPTVFVDPAAEKAVAALLKAYVGTRRIGFQYGIGGPDDIATTVKHGRQVDIVVMPAGPGLHRIEDELLEPPIPLGTIGSTTYYLGVVTSRALPFTSWLPTPKGQAALRANHVR